MPRSIASLTVIGALLAAPAAAQEIAPRTTDYLFATTTNDVRALWINPAGLGVIMEASIMGELAAQRRVGDAFAVEQLSVGFNSRGLAFAYQRDRHPVLSSADVLRFGLGLGSGGGALGAALTFYRSNQRTERGVDLGIRYRPADGVDLGAVIRHIGRPEVRGQELPVSAIAGASWTPLAAHLQLAAEAHATERLGAAVTGYDVSYRTGARLSTGGRLPFGVLVALDLGSDVRIDRWTLGVAIGGNDEVLATASVLPLADGTQHLETISLTGVASRRPPGRQF